MVSKEEVVRNALEQANASQERIDNQRKIINRYDGYRRWVLEEVVPAMYAWSRELASAGQATASAEISTMADRAQLLGENPPEEWQ